MPTDIHSSGSCEALHAEHHQAFADPHWIKSHAKPPTQESQDYPDLGLHNLVGEFYCGSGNLGKALSSKGLHVASIDFVRGCVWHDLTLKEVVDAFERSILAGVFKHNHFGTPCNTYSTARYPKCRSRVKPDGLPLRTLTAKERKNLRVGNKLTRATFRLIDACVRSGTAWSIENPDGSLLWWTKGWRRIQRLYNPVEVVVDYCSYGETYRKRTKLYFWSTDGTLAPTMLAKPCRCKFLGLRHTQWSGWSNSNR